MKAVQLSFSTMVKAIPGLLSFRKKKSLGIDYISTAMLNSDHLGRWRQMSGTNYFTKARQFFEAESMVRTQSLVRLSWYTLKDIKLEREPAFNNIMPMMTHSVRILCCSWTCVQMYWTQNTQHFECESDENNDE